MNRTGCNINSNIYKDWRQGKFNLKLLPKNRGWFNKYRIVKIILAYVNLR